MPVSIGGNIENIPKCASGGGYLWPDQDSYETPVGNFCVSCFFFADLGLDERLCRLRPGHVVPGGGGI